MSEDQKQLTIIDRLSDERLVKALKSVLPKMISLDSFMSMAIPAAKLVAKNPKVSQGSIVISLFKAAKMGLELNETLGEAYLIPYSGICQLIPGYKGLIKLARNSGIVKDIFVTIVYSKELPPFKYYVDETGQKIEHTPNLIDEDRGDPICGYTIATLNDSTKSICVMPYHKIIKRRNNTFAWRSGTETPWRNWEEEMACKTVIRKHAKTLPQSRENHSFTAAIAMDNQLDIGILDNHIPEEIADFTELPPVVESESETETVSRPQSLSESKKKGEATPKQIYVDLIDIVSKSNKKVQQAYAKLMEEYLTKNNKTDIELDNADYEKLTKEIRGILD